MKERQPMADETAKKKITRTVKPVYVVMQVKDNEGNVISLTKENVDILSVHKNSDELLDILDSGGLPEGSFYKRVALA
jgi:hypothetical protein|tara:strand:- start:3262 stop:3495 length:234 start_codon:yes stop_codon:yes gene_type:complete